MEQTQEGKGFGGGGETVVTPLRAAETRRKVIRITEEDEEVKSSKRYEEGEKEKETTDEGRDKESNEEGEEKQEDEDKDSST